MPPPPLALVDDDAEFSAYLAQHLRSNGSTVKVFHDSGDLLADRQAYDFSFYVIELALPGVDGIELIRILRRRTKAGILVVTGRPAPDVFESVINAGADMHLAKPVQFRQVALAIHAVQRRVEAAREQMVSWRLDSAASVLVTPDGAHVPLSGTDLAVMQCFLEAGGGTVTRDMLRQRLGRPAGEASDNLLHATIYRLRRRIERFTPAVVPLQSHARVGYVFRAKLSAA